MRKLFGILPLVIALTLSGCSWDQSQRNVSTFSKYATLRLFELYKTDIQYYRFDADAGVRQRDAYSPYMLPVRIADSDQWMDFTDDLGPKYLTLGKRLQRDTFPAGLEPVLTFIAWSELPLEQRIQSREKLSARPEFTAVDARLELERDTNAPLLVFTKSALAFTRKPQYAVDYSNARTLLRTAVAWHEHPKH
ncbi:hypothetical protein N5J43_24575 [Pseudomonas nicosulfuronedens]|uniref:Lipoprotein n=1 Tax=Pseudomonas nicosulfuronedens TaxID=2571105 RepID=A0A5R9QSN0_9PSED|nr:hypothetical protein [Pseudomonas nicosulfuronedens]MDH1011366.1 hypothetical protein [Pseudomonas nicosulfuronedens]MDH1982141.1 hypothetical protein [Pseudomonas nicosulfuronedens]MDH2029682.1 hypothetical protein [Pseudomonas nicosulfuronedens]TLX72964.1 hypothetical protein FAS41_22145 [Pseudomonas nicosulfuronedens]